MPKVSYRDRPPSSPDRGKVLTIGAGLAVAVLLLYARTLRFEFLSFDDKQYVLENPEVLRGLTGHGVAWAFLHAHAANWHPLTWLSHMADVSMFGLAPWGHHATSVLLHAANAALLFAALRRATRALWPSALAAALFALHPLRAESVAWVAERKDVLSGFFFMLALLSYAAYARRGGPWRYAAVVASFVLGLCAKPMLVTLPFVLLLLDFWPLRRHPERRAAGLLLEKVPLFALSAASCAITFAAQRAELAVASLHEISLGGRLVNALVAYATYLRRTVWPADLSFFYPHLAVAARGVSPWILPALGSLLVLALASFLAIRKRARFPYLAVGWLWFLGTLVPVIGIVQVGMQSMADRYTYLPSIGLCIAVSWGAADLARSRPSLRKPVAAGCVLALVALGVVAARQIGTWRDGPTLYAHALRLDPRNYVALNNLGVLLDRGGRRAEAERYFGRALAIEPTYFDARSNLGTVLVEEGKPAEAAEEYRRAITIHPRSAGAHYNLGVALERAGALGEAEAAYRRAVELDPGGADAHYNLGIVLERRGDAAGAAEEYRAVLRIRPAFDARLGLGIALLAQGKPEEAAIELREAVRMRPDDTEARSQLAKALERLAK